ncbi:MAG TPA: hypothetical protein VGZ00_01300 [Candidatus Baltobacteraceae bacterium]|jgi:hypothetical protein|nr:hypothetical protein [Candidatus Baltobacteraceae bacterium]
MDAQLNSKTPNPTYRPDANEHLAQQDAERNHREEHPYAQPDGLAAFAEDATNVQRTISPVTLNVPTSANGRGRIASTNCILVIEERDATEKEPRSVHVCFTRPPQCTGPITNIIESLITCVYNERLQPAGYTPGETHYYEYARSGTYSINEYFREVQVQWKELSTAENALDKPGDWSNILERSWENFRNTSNLTTSELLTLLNAAPKAIVVGVDWKHFSKVPRRIAESRDYTPSIRNPESQAKPKPILSEHTERPSTDRKQTPRSRPM